LSLLPESHKDARHVGCDKEQRSLDPPGF